MQMQIGFDYKSHAISIVNLRWYVVCFSLSPLLCLSLYAFTCADIIKGILYAILYIYMIQPFSMCYCHSHSY